ncbi:MAG TPA: hypothetical protein VM888_12940 [Chitinophagaceae bacterium]|nr:hypothetical protein [Chitinophagaceae bacterium]
MGKFLIVLIATFFLTSSQAQDFGAYPPSTKWKQINTDTARIIFNIKAQSEANRIASVINRLAKDTLASIGNKLNKINVVLHSNTALANGYVGLGPLRSEFYLIPGSNVFDFGNLTWYEQLAVHEYRHVQQYNNFNNGISKAFYYLFGQQGQLLANALSIPDWFFEGDAVYAETAFTEGGRGRMPYFWKEYKSLWQENKKYSWLKLRNGSYKDFVPNHYYLGYLLANYGYLKYGPDFWQKVTKDASAFKGLIYPFQKAVKKYSGIDYKTFRNNAIAFYKQQTPIENVTKKRQDKTVTNYYYPQFISEDSIVYLKTGYDRINAFYIKDKRGEHRIAQKSIGSEEWFSYRNGEIIYTAYDVNNRYSLQDYNDIVLLNIATKDEIRITKGGKYFSPDLSPSGKKIVAVSITDSLTSELQIIDKENKKVIKKIPFQNGFLFQTKFIDDDNVVYGRRTNDGKISLNRIDLNTLATSELITQTSHTIGFPLIANNTLYFTASFTGTDHIYAYSFKENKISQLTSGEKGNYFPAVFGNRLLWSQFTTGGFAVMEERIDNLPKAEITMLSIQEPKIPFPVAGGYKNILQTSTKNLPVTPYKKSTVLINIHSWSPDYEDPEFTFCVFSDNILANFSNEIFYRYNQNEQSHTTGFSTYYGGLFPLLNGGFDYTANRHIKIPGRELIYNQFEARGGYSIPLNFTYGKTFKYLNFGSNVVWNRLLPVGRFKDSLTIRDVSYLHHFATFQQQLPKALQQIYPRLGYVLSIAHRHQLQKKGYQFLSSGGVFLPSLFKNHSIVFSGSFQQTDTSNVVFSNRFANSSGYREYYFSRMWRTSANYHLPLAYPDLGFASIVYFLRVRTNVFFNYTKVFSNDKSRTRALRSTGIELLFDTKWWNQLPIPVGVRWSYLLDKEIAGPTKRNQWELVIPIDLIPN